MKDLKLPEKLPSLEQIQNRKKVLVRKEKHSTFTPQAHLDDWAMENRSDDLPNNDGLITLPWLPEFGDSDRNLQSTAGYAQPLLRAAHRKNGRPGHGWTSSALTTCGAIPNRADFHKP